MTAEWIVFVESNTSGTGRLFAQAARQLGYEPAIVAADQARYPYVIDDRIRCIQIDTSDWDALLQAILMLKQEKPVAGIYSSSEYFIHVAARLAQLNSLPGPNPDAIEQCRDKRYQRQCLFENRIRVPAFMPATSLQEALGALKVLEFPVIIKPAFGTGSVGVRLCRTKEELCSHVESLLQLKTNERGMPIPSAIVVEEYLQGQEYSVEMFHGNVVGITLKHVSPEPVFVEMGHDFPAAIGSEVASAIHDVAIRSLEVMGLLWGPCHIELRVTPSGPVIVEINPRLAGGFIPELVRLALGIDLIQEIIKLVVGKMCSVQPVLKSYASIRFLVPSTEGTIKDIKMRPGMPNVDIALYRSVGEQVHLRGDFRDRIGHVIAHGINREEAMAWAEIGRNNLKVELVH